MDWAGDRVRVDVEFAAAAVVALVATIAEWVMAAEVVAALGGVAPVKALVLLIADIFQAAFAMIERRYSDWTSPPALTGVQVCF